MDFTIPDSTKMEEALHLSTTQPVLTELGLLLPDLDNLILLNNYYLYLPSDPISLSKAYSLVSTTEKLIPTHVPSFEEFKQLRIDSSLKVRAYYPFFTLLDLKVYNSQVFTHTCTNLYHRNLIELYKRGLVTIN